MSHKFGERWKTRRIRPSQAVRIIDFCITEIKKEGKISAEELVKRVMKELPGVVVTPHWLSRRIKIFNHAGIEKYYTTTKGKHVVVYSIRGTRKTKKCLYCGRRIPMRYLNFCSSQCEKELEKIANFFIPLPEGLKYSLDEIKDKMVRMEDL